MLSLSHRLTVVIFVFGLFAALWRAPEARASQDCVLGAELDGVVSGGVAEYLADAVGAAEREECVLLVRVDTPGGQLGATRDIAQVFLGADAPVVVYVEPRGAQAASAGTFITMAGHVAAMAPGTNIGAAHPVGLGGDPDEPTGEKVRMDTAALARSIADARGRNAEWAEQAVLESVSATATEALDLGVIDHVETSQPGLLTVIDGEEVELASGETAVLSTRGAEVSSFDMTLRQRVVAALGNPEIAYLLLMLGLLGLLIELASPGILVPGIVGGLALFLAAIGLEILPVSVGGLLLLALGVGLLVAEVYFGAYGLLALGGLGSLIFGSILLIDRGAADYFAEQELVISWGVIVPLAVVLAGAAVTLAWKLGRSHREPSPTGVGGLVGTTGVALDEVDAGGGAVRIGSERWRARADAPIAAGSRVEVIDVEGLVLRVRRGRHAAGRRAERAAGGGGAAPNERGEGGS